jgi:hypothetical protein
MLTIRGKEWTSSELLKTALGWLVAVAIVGGIVFGGVAIILHGSGEIARAYDDPNTASHCTAQRASNCVSIERGRVQKGDIDNDVYVVTEDRVEPIALVNDAFPEVGTIVELERRDGSIVSLHDPVSGRRYHTENWPRHGRDVGYGVFIILLGVGIAGAVLVPLTVLGVQALRRAW